MTLDDRYLLVRAASLYVVVMLTIAVWAWRRPGRRAVSGAALAGLWNVPVLLTLHVAARHWGWWRFDASGGLFLGIPVDLYFAWVWLWGVIPALAFPSLSPVIVMALALVVDLVLMPASAPVVRLGHSWLVGELAGLLLGLLPGLFLARWTARDERLVGRVVLQMLAFGGLLMFVLPAIVIEGTGGRWTNPLSSPAWQLGLFVQALAIPAVFGLTAVQEFATRGRGTPVPFDPPRSLVTSGVYAYVRNPMQLSAVVTLLILGLVLRNAWVSASGVMAHLYSVGLAGWDEDEDMRRRFGSEWIAYRDGVRRWLPRLRPWDRPGRPAARLFVSKQCGMCREVGQWFDRRRPRGLSIVAAETHQSGALRRITYEPADGTPAASGVEAVARALEHVHLGWAFLGFALRLPVVSQLSQLLADASGAEPRALAGAGTVCGVRGQFHG